jgi:hypothetical protein
MPKEEHHMFKKIKEFFTGKPAVVETPAAEVPHKVETPLVQLGPETTPAPAPTSTIEATAVVEFVPAGTEATVATPAKKTKAPAKPKAEKTPKAPAVKKPRAPKAK